MTTSNPRLAGKRQILFQGGRSVDELPSEEKKEQKVKKAIVPKMPFQKKESDRGGTLEERTISIYKWLSEHRLVNLNKLCETCNIDRANFVKGVAANKVIRQDILEKFETTLKLYGYGN